SRSLVMVIAAIAASALPLFTACNWSPDCRDFDPCCLDLERLRERVPEINTETAQFRLMLEHKRRNRFYRHTQHLALCRVLRNCAFCTETGHRSDKNNAYRVESFLRHPHPPASP